MLPDDITLPDRAHTGPSVSGVAAMRTLRPSDRQRFLDHLLRLDPQSRRDRFNGGVSEAFLAAYAARSFRPGSQVVASLEDGRVIAAAELHPLGGGHETMAEAAFSVERQYQGQGLGSLLFAQLLNDARRRGFDRVVITTHAGNLAMRRLAARHGARLTFGSGEAVGCIDLAGDTADPSARQADRPVPHAGATPRPASPVAVAPVASDARYSRPLQTKTGRARRPVSMSGEG